MPPGQQRIPAARTHRPRARPPHPNLRTAPASQPPHPKPRTRIPTPARPPHPKPRTRIPSPAPRRAHLRGRGSAPPPPAAPGPAAPAAAAAAATGRRSSPSSPSAPAGPPAPPAPGSGGKESGAGAWRSRRAHTAPPRRRAGLPPRRVYTAVGGPGSRAPAAQQEPLPALGAAAAGEGRAAKPRLGPAAAAGAALFRPGHGAGAAGSGKGWLGALPPSLCRRVHSQAPPDTCSVLSLAIMSQ